MIRYAVIAAWVFFPLAGQAAGPTQPGAPRQVVAAADSCRQAVSQSRLVCLSGFNCQREISPVLRSCAPADSTACMAARDELRTHCAPQSRWYGSRECDAALTQVSHYCGR